MIKIELSEFEFQIVYITLNELEEVLSRDSCNLCFASVIQFLINKFNEGDIDEETG